MGRHAKFYGWYLVAALSFITFVNIAFPMYGAGVINAVMTKELHLSRSTLGLGFTVLVMSQGLFGPVIAWAIHRFGPRRTMFFGCLVLAAGALMMATLVTEGWQYVVVFGTLLGLGMGLSTSIPAQTVVTFWFEKKRALALSIVWAGTGVGGFVAAPLLNNVIGLWGNWRAGWFFVAGAAIVTSLVAIVLVRNKPGDMGQVADGDQGLKPANQAIQQAAKSGKVYRTADNWPVKEAMKSSANLIVMFCAIAFGIASNVVLAHGVIHLMDLGHSPAVAAKALGLVALASVFGKLVSGYLADRIEPRYVWSASLLMMTVGVLLLVQATSAVEIYVSMALLGWGNGASIICRSTIIGNYFGPKSFAGLLGMQAPIVIVSMSAAPFLVGLVYDRHGSYGAAFLGIAALVFIGAVASLVIKPPSRVAGQALGIAETEVR